MAASYAFVKRYRERMNISDYWKGNRLAALGVRKGQQATLYRMWQTDIIEGNSNIAYELFLHADSDDDLGALNFEFVSMAPVAGGIMCMLFKLVGHWEHLDDMCFFRANDGTLRKDDGSRMGNDWPDFAAALQRRKSNG